MAGGGEDDETPLPAARREAFEEARISPDAAFLPLDTTTSIRMTCFRESHHWGEDRFVVPEYAFGVQTGLDEGPLIVEYVEVRWLPFALAEQPLNFDSNRVALGELNLHIGGLVLRETAT